MKVFLFFVVVGLGTGCKMKDPCEKCVSHCTFVEFHDGKSLCLMSAIGISGVRFLIPPGGEEMCSSEENDEITSVEENPHGMENADEKEESGNEETLEGAHSQGIGVAGETIESVHFPKKADGVGGISEGAHSLGNDGVGGISEGVHSQRIDRVVGTTESAHLSGMDRAGDEKGERQEGRNETNQKMDEVGFPWWGFLIIGIVSFCLILVVLGLLLNVLETKYHRHRDDCYDHL